MSSADTEKTGNLLLQLLRPHRDPKQLELVKRIIDRTKGGKIAWQRSPTDCTAIVADKLAISFVYTYGLLSQYTVWKLFTVRDERGSELIKVENSRDMSGFLGAIAGREVQLADPDPLVDVVNDLYSTVEQEAKGDIDKAITIVEQA